MELCDNVGGCSSLQSQAHIWNHIFNFINSMSLKCAVELCIPEAIHKHGGQPVTLSQLVQALEIPPAKAAFLRRLMRLLIHSGFFSVQRNDSGEEGYLITNISKYLLVDHPRSLKPFILFQLDTLVLTPWQSLSAWYHAESSTPLRRQHGASFWDLASQMPELNIMFNEAMASDSVLTMDVAIREHGEIFRQLTSLVDVGGGNGAVAMALAEAFSHVKCTVFDLPHVVASAPKSTAVEFLAGDMFEYVPRAGAVLLKWILHDWSDEHCVKLLKLCKEAIPPKEEGGKVIIMDMVVGEGPPQQETRETQYFLDLLMMVLTEGGKERSEEEWRKLFLEAGFSGYKITALGSGLQAIIEIYP